MKKTLLLLIIFFKCFIVYSQENQIKSYLQVQDSLFQHLDKSKIITGTLYDRVFCRSAFPHYVAAVNGPPDRSINN